MKPSTTDIGEKIDVTVIRKSALEIRDNAVKSQSAFTKDNLGLSWLAYEASIDLCNSYSF